MTGYLISVGSSTGADVPHDALLTAWFLANHQLSEPNAIIGWVFAGIVATAAFLLISSIEERKAVKIASVGWAVGIGLLILL